MSVQTEVRELGQCRTTAVTIEISYWLHIRESPARPRRQVSGARVPPQGLRAILHYYRRYCVADRFE